MSRSCPAWRCHTSGSRHAGTGLPAILLAAGIATAPVVGCTAARAAGEPDANWVTGLNAPGMDGQVRAICEYRGELVAGGTFRTIGSQVVAHVALWDGAQWHPLGTGTNGTVTQVAAFGGELVAAGDFETAGDVPASRIARWDGASWHPLGDGLLGTPNCIAVHRDSLFVGGMLARAGPVAVNGLACWDGTSWHDGGTVGGAWPHLSVTNLAEAGGRLYATYAWAVTGSDSTNSPVPTRTIAWNGRGWDRLPDNLVVSYLATVGDSLYASGQYEGDVPGVPTSGDYVCRWSGSEWIVLGRVWPNDPGVVVGHNGELYLARSAKLYRWSGTEWSVASQPRSADFDVLFSGRDGLYAGGSRIVDGETTSHGLARWDGSVWSGVGDQSGSGLNLWTASPAVLLAPAGEGFFAGGTFLRAGSIPTSGLVRWDGYSWQTPPASNGPFRPNAFLDLEGILIATRDDFFTTGCWVEIFDGSRWIDRAWFSAPVLTITPWTDRLAVGGLFAPEHIQTVPQVVIDPDDLFASLGPGLNGIVRASCRLDGQLVLSGDFTATADGGIRLRHAGLWDGNVWRALGDGLPEPAISLVPYAGGVAAAMADGVLLWSGATWNRLGDAFDGPVRTLAVYEGDLVAGGAFARAGAASLGGLARWGEGRWQPLGSGMNGEVQDMLALGEDLWVSGAFTAAGSVPSSGLADWREPRAGVENFRARVQEDSISLSWRDPDNTAHRSTVVRWSRYDYPADPEDGLPFPFGDEGRFPASPGTVHPFRHFVPLDGGKVYYSVFAVHTDGRSSAPQRAAPQLADRLPPALTLDVHRLPSDEPQIAVTVRCAERLDLSRIEARLDSARVRMTQVDHTGKTWAGASSLGGPGANSLIVCARDPAGNERCVERIISTAWIDPRAPGQCVAAGGGLIVAWGPGLSGSPGLISVISGDSDPPAFEVAGPAGPSRPLALSFLVRSENLPLVNPRRLAVILPDSSVQGGVFDPASGRLTVHSSTPGTYRLVLTEEERSTLADPVFLAVAPAVPNPFRSETVFGYELQSQERVRVTVHDAGGRTVAVLFDGLTGPGRESIRWTGCRQQRADAEESAGDAACALPSGAYFARIQSEHASRIVRLVKIR